MSQFPGGSTYMPTNNRNAADQQPAQTLSHGVIYADRITAFGVGPAVSRLTLSMEADDNTVTSIAQIVMPTPALFDALEFMANAIENDESVKKGIIDALDSFKAKLTAASNKQREPK